MNLSPGTHYVLNLRQIAANRLTVMGCPRNRLSNGDITNEIKKRTLVWAKLNNKVLVQRKTESKFHFFTITKEWS